LAQANSTLPLVKRIVGDIVRVHAQAVKTQAELEFLGSKDRSVAQGQLEKSMTRLEDFVDELSEIGCELKDYEVGLIDFTGRHQGRDVCLCWKLGEERISYWHELDKGAAGRQPVSKLQESE
jgi:hypothetical protein